MFRDLAAVESNPDTVKSTFDRNGSHTAWYIKYYGEYASIRDCVDDNWSSSDYARERTPAVPSRCAPAFSLLCAPVHTAVRTGL